MKTLRLKFREFRVVSAILWANARLQIAGALYIIVPSQERYASFERKSLRLNKIFECDTTPTSQPRSIDEQRCAELIARQMDVIGLN